MILEPNNDEVVVFEELFVTGLCMPPHSALAGHLNQVFEQMGVPYAPCLLPGTEAS
jgi:hypothetical protein